MSESRIIKTPAKILHYGDDVRNIFLDGVNGVVDAVKTTLGPNGRIVSIYHAHSSPEATKDGVTVARSIQFADEAKNAAARYVIEAAMKTVNDAGDGTTTCSIFTQALYGQAMEQINSGLNPIKIKKAIDFFIEEAVELIKINSEEIKGNPDLLYNVAKISANNNEYVADLILEATHHVGPLGSIEYQNSKNEKTTVEKITGCDLDQGYVHPAFINTDKNTCEFENALICVIDEDAISHKEIDKLLAISVTKKQPLLIIADDFNADVLSVLILNANKGNIKVCPVRGPGYGDRRREYLRDICALTGATLIGGTESGISVPNVKFEHLGTCEKFVSKKDKTTIVGGNADEGEVERRINRHRISLEETEEELAKKFYEKQISRLTGGVAVIRVGGQTSSEQKELKYLVEDAVLAVKAAVKEGISVGGGCNFFRISKSLRNAYKSVNIDSTDLSKGKFRLSGKKEKEVNYQKIGLDIVCNALEAIVQQLAYNGGHNIDDIVEVYRNTDYWDHGFNAKTERFENLKESGIIDATRVQRSALQNAASIAGVMIQCECLIVPDYQD